MSPSRIEWTDETWNPTTGCTPISEGCAHCYAKRMATRLRGRFGYPEDDPFRVTWHGDRLDQPFHWRKPRRVFVCSMGDLFHDEMPMERIREVLALAWEASQHTYLFLTKRPKRMWEAVKTFLSRKRSNVWLGVTIENQRLLNERMAILATIPASIRYVSLEPLLGPVDLRPWLDVLDWVIVGGETGPGARPMSKSWVQQISKQCREARVPYFFKKWGDVTAARMERELNCLEAQEFERREYPEAKP